MLLRPVCNCLSDPLLSSRITFSSLPSELINFIKSYSEILSDANFGAQENLNSRMGEILTDYLLLRLASRLGCSAIFSCSRGTSALACFSILSGTGTDASLPIFITGLLACQIKNSSCSGLGTISFACPYIQRKRVIFSLPSWDADSSEMPSSIMTQGLIFF